MIPSQTSIFFPILNDIVSFATDPHLKTEEELIIYAKADLDSTRSLFAVVDEREVADLWDFRVRTSIFDLELPVTKGSKKHVKTKAVSDGYWLFLAPLTKGDHTIYFSGEKLDFDKVRTFNSAKLPIFRVEVKYELTIKE